MKMIEMEGDFYSPPQITAIIRYAIQNPSDDEFELGVRLSGGDEVRYGYKTDKARDQACLSMIEALRSFH